MEQLENTQADIETTLLSPFGVELALPIETVAVEGLSCLDTKPDGDTYPEEDMGPPAFPDYDCRSVTSLQ